MVVAPLRRRASRPDAPSSPIPVRITPIPPSAPHLAMLWKRTSADGRWRVTGSSSSDSRRPRRTMACSPGGATKTTPGRSWVPSTASSTWRADSRRTQDPPGPERGASDGELAPEGGPAAHPTEEAVHEAGLQVLDDDDRALQTNQAGENPGQGRGAAGGGRQSDPAIGAALRASDGGARLPDHQSPEPLAAALREVAEGTEPLAQLRSDREIPLGGVGHHLHGAGDNRRH